MNKCSYCSTSSQAFSVVIVLNFGDEKVSPISPFSCLIALAWTSSTMLMSANILPRFPSEWKSIQHFSIKRDVSCKVWGVCLFLGGLGVWVETFIRLRKFSSVSNLLSIFCLFKSWMTTFWIWEDVMVFLLFSVNVGNCTDWLWDVNQSCHLFIPIGICRF